MRRLFFVFFIILVLGILTRFRLKSYSLELVHIVVVNAVVQKAPNNYPKSKVYEAFSACLEQVRKKENQDYYMQQLLTLSHRLEKVQYLEEEEVDDLLENLDCK